MRRYQDATGRTYKAENLVFQSAKVNKPYGFKKSQAVVARYLPGWKVIKNPRKGAACCYVDTKKISLGSSSPLWVVCHEISHGLVGEARLPMGHHEVFRQFYVDVVRVEMGPYWANKLKKGFANARLLTCYPGEQPLGWLARLRRRIVSSPKYS